MSREKSEFNLSEALRRLQAINDWFDRQEEPDVEEGLKKLREGASLVKESRARLKEVENEFLEIQKELEES